MITPRRDGWVLGDFDDETFLDCAHSLERVEDELKVRQVVVEPLRTMFVAAKEVLQEPFSTEIGVYCSGQKELVCCWKCISMNVVPVHWKCVYRKGLINQNWEHIKWKSVTETYQNRSRLECLNLWKLNSISIYPISTLFDCLSIVDTYLPKRWICLVYDESWWQNVLVTTGGYSIPLRIGWDNMFLLTYWYMIPLLCCR